MQKDLSFIMYYWSSLLFFTRKLNCYFDKSLHVQLSDPTCLQKFRPVPLTVFEIQGFKLKNKNNDKKNWRNRTFAISPMFVIQLSPKFRKTYILPLAIILRFQRWVITESESVNPSFRMYMHNGPRPCPSLYTKYYSTL